MTNGGRLMFGVPVEQEAFVARYSAFFETLHRLKELCERVFLRQIEPQEPAQSVVFMLGRATVEDFHEILLLGPNGYGIGALKLARAMFERVVTMLYLSSHPEEVADFLDYYWVHRWRMINHARDTGIDLGERVGDQEITRASAEYDRVKGKYEETICAKCGTKRVRYSWSRKDLRTMAIEVGLGPTYTMAYFWPTLLYHTTAVGMEIRLHETDGGISFRWEAQRQEAGQALAVAHVCLAMALETANRALNLGLDAEMKTLKTDVQRCWQV